MDGFPRRRFAFVLLSCLGMTGCAGALSPGDPQMLATQGAVDAANPSPSAVAANNPAAGVDPGTEAPPYSPYLATPYSPPTGTSAPPAAAVSAAAPLAAPQTRAPANEAEAMQKILVELQSLGTVDPAVQQQLLADLRQTDPALWPMMMQTFRAGMAYRQRAANPAPSQTAATQIAAAPTAEKIVATVPKPATITPPVVPPTAMLDAAAMQLNPRGGGTPGLSFPATAMLQAAMANAQQQAAAATEPAPPSVADTPIRTVSHTAPVVKATKDEDDSPAETVETKIDWQKAVTSALADLETQTAEPPTSAQEVSRHVWQRVLCLAAGRRDDALKPIPGIAAAEQDFWTEQLFALATYLDTEKVTDPARRSAAAAQHLAKAAARLSEASTLAVKNLAFCTEVSSYGVYQKFKDDEFKAGQPLILYAEVENFKSDESSKGFHTALRSSYQILDAQGRRVAENDLALTEEYCQNRRRDYFIRYFLSIPERIYVGKYTLQLTIVDTLSQKIGQSTIDFTVTEK